MARSILIAGLTFGDEGKGTTVDFLTRHYSSPLTVRYNGGAQAAHNVHTTDGKHHCFAQFGSGTLAGANTYLSEYMLVNPIFALTEAKHLSSIGVTDPFTKLFVNEKALVTTPYHVALNRINELVRINRHGSCGMGIGETVSQFLNCPSEALRMDDLLSPNLVSDKLKLIQERCILRLPLTITETIPDIGFIKHIENPTLRKEFEILFNDSETWVDLFRTFANQVNIVSEDWFKEQTLSDEVIIFEGAQGALLDQDYGFHPHVTWTDTTFSNALSLLEGVEGSIHRLGILRSYMTRHGAGPFVSESKTFDDLSVTDDNKVNDWQGNFRSGALDLVAIQYGIDVIGVDGLVITHLDRLKGRDEVEVCKSYQYSDQDSRFFLTSFYLKRNTPFDIDYQIKLTEAIYRAKPVYLNIKSYNYADFLRDVFTRPVVITSHGKTAASKQFCLPKSL